MVRGKRETMLTEIQVMVDEALVSSDCITIMTTTRMT